MIQIDELRSSSDAARNGSDHKECCTRMPPRVVPGNISKVAHHCKAPPDEFRSTNSHLRYQTHPKEIAATRRQLIKSRLNQPEAVAATDINVRQGRAPEMSTLRRTRTQICREAFAAIHNCPTATSASPWFPSFLRRKSIKRQVISRMHATKCPCR